LRHIAFQIQYDGRKFFGFAAQDGSGVDTVESIFFAALEKLNLIADRKTCGYSRCGRTDRGVSALGQIVALKVRSSIPLMISITDANAVAKEMDYCTMLNRCLPEEIRVLGWTAVTEEFSARFSASNRRYRYFFVRRDLDITAMQEACQFLVGSFDFRNFCKLDVANVSNFVREIFSAEIKPFIEYSNDLPSSVYMLEICGIAFLWHMVRCIMAVLFLVGEKKEQPAIVSSLLDVVAQPAKPSYIMADDAPLVLHDCAFEHLSLQHSVRSLWELTAHYRTLRDRHLVAMAQARNSLEYLFTQCKVPREEIAQFVQDLQAKQSRVVKRLQSKGIVSEPSADTDSSAVQTTSKKRSFEVMSDSEHISSMTSGLVPWQQAVQEIQEAVSMAPAVEMIPHVPLLQRKREETYEERVKSIMGQKKTRFDRHVQLSTAAAGGSEGGVDDEEALEDSGTGPQSASTKAFFATMRQQGSISLLGGYRESASTELIKVDKSRSVTDL
jgi:tRNA pseudouridine38/39 synthase